MSVYNKKDIIMINKEIGEDGTFQNESSLDFALNIIKQKKSWLYELSYLIRSLLIDHTFHDGNKRTAYLLSTLYFQDKNFEYDNQKLVDCILKIARKNIVDVNQIMRLLKKC